MHEEKGNDTDGHEEESDDDEEHEQNGDDDNGHEGKRDDNDIHLIKQEQQTFRGCSSLLVNLRLFYGNEFLKKAKMIEVVFKWFVDSVLQ